MKFIKDLKEGDRVFDIYLCKHKQAAVTKNGKPYDVEVRNEDDDIVSSDFSLTRFEALAA